MHRHGDSATELRIWSSTSKASLYGGELTAPSRTSFELVRNIAEIDPTQARGLAFILVPIPPTLFGPETFHAAAKAASAANASSTQCRLCLTVDAKVLHEISYVNDKKVGLILDDVDADTPLSAIANEALEAIRFAPAFVRVAAGDLRLGCILESMLLLAKNLGLATMGLPTGATAPNFVPVFDYVPRRAGFERE